jgi:hypothetical protein
MRLVTRPNEVAEMRLKFIEWRKRAVPIPLRRLDSIDLARETMRWMARGQFARTGLVSYSVDDDAIDRLAWSATSASG